MLHARVPLLSSPIPDCCLQVVQLWRKDLAKINPKAAESLADPAQYANLFPDMDLALKAEQVGQGLWLRVLLGCDCVHAGP